MEEHIGKMGTSKRDTLEEELRIDFALNKYDDQILFPEKLAKANEMLRKTGLPKQWLKEKGERESFDWCSLAGRINPPNRNFKILNFAPP